MKSLKFALIVLTLLPFITACDDNDQLPRDTINSPNGLIIDLEWTTGGSATQALDEVDLDLLLTSGVDLVDESESADFERVRIENFYRDGSYILSITYFDGISNVDFSVFLRGTSSTSNIVVESSFSGNEQGLTIDYLEIVKSGTTYTINLL